MAEQVAETNVATQDLSVLVITLLKGVLYHDDNELLWNSLLRLQARVRDYVSLLGLELVLDDAEGHAFLRSRPESVDDSPAKVPRLVARRSLSFPVSLLLALLRKKLAEFDASGGETRLVLSRDEIVELLRVFLPENSNEAKLVDTVETHITKIVDLGFLRQLKSGGGSTGKQAAMYEVRRILKSFVDAQWLADFDLRLASYQAVLEGESGGTDDE